MLELKVHDGDRVVVLRFEHSLLSLSKWESKHKVAFLTTQAKTATEMIEYFQDMLLSPEDDPNLVLGLSPEQLDQLAIYMNESQTASSVPAVPLKKSGETITSELIYYWLVGMQIPFEVQTWHLSRLMMLVEITNYKNQPEKKRKPGEVVSDMIHLNNERRKKFNTNG